MIRSDGLKSVSKVGELQNLKVQRRLKAQRSGEKSILNKFWLPNKRRRLYACHCSFTEGLSASLASRLQKQKDKGLLPCLELSHKEAVERQLTVLQHNNLPYADHGLEIMYRYSSFDPFERSKYFGRSLDLGQFERFRRIFHTPTYSVLLCHKEHKLLSSLKVSDHKWKQRIEVVGAKPNSWGSFTFTMVQWVGGHFDGIWFCESLVSDDPAQIHT